MALFFLFYDWIVFHCLYIPHLFNPLILVCILIICTLVTCLLRQRLASRYFHAKGGGFLPSGTASWARSESTLFTLSPLGKGNMSFHVCHCQTCTQARRGSHPSQCPQMAPYTPEVDRAGLVNLGTGYQDGWGLGQLPQKMWLPVLHCCVTLCWVLCVPPGPQWPIWAYSIGYVELVVILEGLLRSSWNTHLPSFCLEVRARGKMCCVIGPLGCDSAWGSPQTGLEADSVKDSWIWVPPEFSRFYFGQVHFCKVSQGCVFEFMLRTLCLGEFPLWLSG